MKEFSFEKASKFSERDRFFDINYVWVPGLFRVTKMLFYTTIRPEAIVLVSMVAGAASGWFYAKGDYASAILGALFIQIKNYLDTVDGHLARVRGQESRLGRFLDSLSDAVAYICLFTGIGVRLFAQGMGRNAYILSYAAMLTGFLLCSVYCFYLVSYKSAISGEGINRPDEGIRQKERIEYRKGMRGRTLFALHSIYLAVYGWQDRLVAAIDRTALKRAVARAGAGSSRGLEQRWYEDKRFLSLVAPLCFGTQIMILTLFTLFNHIAEFLWFLIIAGNAYALCLILGRKGGLEQ